jgi:2-polyprenyl-3-methyl-5-hydroxy-6-metoxy-1,4-benzoquinol methylase
MDNDLISEAESFDNHVQTRVSHGMIPDLRRAQACDWFYNNIWRRPYLLDMVFGRDFRFAMAHHHGRSLLEVGSGPGHLALEFARAGLEVTGLELSGKCVEIARRYANENPYTDGYGSLSYVQGDFLDWEPCRTFDTICFFGTLHHFKKPAMALEKVDSLLAKNGRLIVVEPARDDLTAKDALIIALIRQLLALQNGWFEKLVPPRNANELEGYITECLREYKEARDKTEATQSPRDNSTYSRQIIAALRGRFNEVAHQKGFCFIHRVGAGVRSESEEHTRMISEFLALFDKYAVDHGVLNPGEFLWAGEKMSL